MPAIHPALLPDDKLLLECRFEAFVASGPGGQKRHKTYAAVRYTHLPTRIHAVSTDSRSQRENKIHALRELRHKLAMELRDEVDPITYTPPSWFKDYPGLGINPKNPLYPAAVIEVMNTLKSSHWNPAPAAALLGHSTSALTRFLHNDPALWTRLNQIRAELGMPALQKR